MRAHFFMKKVNSEPAAKPEAEPEKKRKNWFGIVVLIILFLVLLGGLAYVGKLYLDSQNRLKALQGVAATQDMTPSEDEITSLVNEVGRHLAIPNDRPKVVTLAAVAQLKKNQPFFANAEDGDKLLVFVSKVILYRPSIDKVIDIAQIRPSTTVTAASVSAELIPETSTASSTVAPKANK